MVLPDFSDSFRPLSTDQAVRIAPVFDRLMALFIDFLIFSPLVALANSLMMRDLRALMWSDPASQQAVAVWISLVAGSLLLCILAESLFLYLRGATPGQVFMKIQVRAWPDQGPLSLTQCLSRTTMWWLSFPFLLPLLGAFTNSQRRTFHDRASETVVATRKLAGDPGPMEIEVRFFKSWSQMLLLLMMLTAVVTLLERHRHLHETATLTDAAAGPLCAQIDQRWVGVERLDQALAGFLAGEWEADCLEAEADHALWNEGFAPLASVAKALSVEDEEVSKAYLSRACELEARGESCALARFLVSEDADRDEILEEKNVLLSARMLLLKDRIDRDESAQASMRLLRGLRGEELLHAWLDRQEVRLFWSLREKSDRARRPASAADNQDQDQDLLEEFKTRYELK